MSLPGEKVPTAAAEVIAHGVIEDVPISIKEDKPKDKPATPSLADYWVRLCPLVIVLIADASQRVLSFRSRGEGYALSVSCLCALGSGAVSSTYISRVHG